MKTYFLPEEFRPKLKEIFGTPIFGTTSSVAKQYNKLIKEKEYSKIITVGDYCSKHLRSDIKIFDGKVQRKTFKKRMDYSLSFINQPATIQKEAWDIVKKAIKENKHVYVEGEEDLIVIPAVLLAKNGTAVVYGFPKKGVCVLEASDGLKKQFREFLKNFSFSASKI